MNKCVLLTLAFILLFSCKNQNVIDPSTLPQDVAIKPKYSGQRDTDGKILQDLYAEIERLANESPCYNIEKWKVAPLGSKPCGGPEKYIAYPIKIEDSIAPKIAEFTEKQREFNAKYEVTSDCNLVTEPTEIRCENNKAILFYPRPESEKPQ